MAWIHEFNQVQALVAWGLKLAIRRPKEAKLSKSPSIYRSSPSHWIYYDNISAKHEVETKFPSKESPLIFPWLKK